MKALKQSDVNDLIQLHQAGQFHLAEIKAKKLFDEWMKDHPEPVQELVKQRLNEFLRSKKKSALPCPF